MNWMLDSDGNRTDYLYDSIGRLTGIWAANYDYVSFNYDAGGRLLEKMTSAGTDTRYSYNPDNSLAGLTNKHGLNTISNHAYSYDPLGNRSGQTETVGATTTNYTYGYDNLNRLTQVQNGSPAQQENYRYDPIGNRTSKSIGATLPSITAYVYDASNQLKEIRSGSATGTLLASLTYDADGNLKSRSDSGLTLGYDPLNRLTQATLGGQTQSYSYDDQGRRISKTVGTATTNFLYNDADIVAEYPATWGLPAAQYTHGNKIDDINIRATATAAQYFHQDGLGSVVGVTNQAGLTDATQRFDAWGNKLAATGAAPRYGYTGREPDETGLTYYRARYYDPSLGRFTQRDPIGLRGGLNRYAYVANDPCNATDPSGEFGLVGAVIGATINISMQMFKDGKSIGEINIGQVVVSAAVGAFTPGVFVMGGLLIGTESAIENWGWISLKDALIWQVTGEGSGAIAKQILEQKPWTFNGDSSNSNTAPSSTSVHGGGATVGGLPGRIAVPAAPYAGNQK